MPEARAKPAGAPIEFAISRGGPIFILLRVIGLQPEGRRAMAAALVTAVVTWVPLLLFSLKDHLAFGGNVVVPFLRDVSAYARFLVAAPLLILAGPAIDARLSAAVSRLVTGGVVPAARRSDFDRALAGLTRARDSWIPEAVMVTIVITLAWLDVTHGVRGTMASWITGDGGSGFTTAGWWYSVVSLPIFLLLALRWLWRVIIWAGFLKRIAALDLDLISTHPDGVGGLGGVAEACIGFNMVVAAFSVTLGAAVAGRMLFAGETLANSKLVIGAFVVLSALLFLGPLLVFTPPLARARFLGLLDYGDLADDYVRSFDLKWMRRAGRTEPDGDRMHQDEPLLGSSDVQSLADIGGSYQRVAAMKPVLITYRLAILLVASALLPMIAPLSTVIPVVQILEKLLALIAK